MGPREGTESSHTIAAMTHKHSHAHQHTYSRTFTNNNEQKESNINFGFTVNQNTHIQIKGTFVQDTGHFLCGALSSRAQRSAATAPATAMQLPQNVFHCQLG